MAVGTIYVDTGGATTNSGTSDTNGATLSGTGDAVVTGSTIQLTIGADLSLIAADGSQAIYLAQATNSNQKIFWITGKDDALDQVTVSVAPTGVTASNWAIGGRLVWTPANVEAALRAGDTVQFNNSPAARASSFITTRVSGDSTTGMINFVGKSGVRPVLNVTNTSVPITNTVNSNNWNVANLEIDQDGASGDGISIANGAGWVVDNVKVSDAGGNGISVTSAGNAAVTRCEITGCGAAGVSFAQNTGALIGNYIHDNTGNGITLAGTGIGISVFGNVIDTNGGKGIALSGAPTTQAFGCSIINNTVYGNGDSGLEITDADAVVNLFNNIFSENGNAAGEFNIEWAAGSAELHGFHGYNCFFHSGGGGGANLSGLTANSTESTSDPLLNNPAAGDFTLQTASPCKATGFPGVLLGGSTGYMDMGAIQRQEPAGSGGLLAHPGMRGGFV